MKPVIATGHTAAEAGLELRDLCWHLYAVMASSPADAKEQALDKFHCEVPIKMLEFVDIWDRVTDVADPEDSNDARAAWASTALDAFIEVTGTDWDGCLCDLLCDLRHWADRHGQDWDAQMARAMNHYAEETLDPDLNAMDRELNQQ